MATEHSHGDPVAPMEPANALPTFGWVVRRSLFGIAVLTILMGGTAWLMHASIKPADAVTSAVGSATPSTQSVSSEVSRSQTAQNVRERVDQLAPTSHDVSVGRFAVRAVDDASIAP